MSRVGPLNPGPVRLAPKLSLSDLLWIANTRHGPGGHWFARGSDDVGDHDHLVDYAHAVRYLTDHHVALPSDDVQPNHLGSLAEIREMVRGLVDPTADWTPSVLSILEGAGFRIDPDGSLVSARSGWDAFIEDLMLPLLQLVEVRTRVRTCANPSCRLMFLDLSRNRARIWCDNAGCGNRARVRRYRSRAKAADLTAATDST
ncbi:MAG: CGNR zinc finger domain-containing protein [Chloroflexi bacterium]|nr:CGNR zinc finger domain-containing protein [Chloroflexota bacterium]